MVKQVTEPVAGNYFPINTQILVQVPLLETLNPEPQTLSLNPEC